MKIAFVTDDKKTISQHFGRATYYLIVTLDDGKIVSRESRDKLGHAQFSAETHLEEMHEADPRGHGFDPTSQNRHAQMAAAIADCQVLVVGGMGSGAYASMIQKGIEVYVTQINDIDEAVKLYLEGKLINQQGLLH